MAREMPNYGSGRGSAEGSAAVRAAQGDKAPPERDLFAAAADTPALSIGHEGKGPLSFGNPRPGREAAPPAPAKGADSSLADALAPQLSMDTGDEVVQKAAPGLSDKFVVPPFSVLDTRAGYWQERRRAWLSLGMRGETTAEQPYSPNGGRRPPSGGSVDAGGGPAPLKAEAGGRAQGLIYEGASGLARKALYDGREHGLGESQSVATGTSVFDPVLCEIAYRWFSGTGAVVVDPFAGGVVRGLLAAVLGREYHGVELRPEQVADNRAQATRLLGGDLDFGRDPIPPRWYEGDAVELHSHGLPRADLIFTCPPYADLEVYSDNPKDLSTMPYEQFRQMYGRVMVRSAEVLKDDRFAVWVVGEARGKDGLAYGFVADTVRAARVGGLALYNEAILVNSVGSAALRAQRIIRNRKLTRVHQHVLVFVKGDPKRAAAACGSAEVEA